jgi:hypothetical protein
MKRFNTFEIVATLVQVCIQERWQIMSSPLEKPLLFAYSFRYLSYINQQDQEKEQ